MISRVAPIRGFACAFRQPAASLCLSLTALVAATGCDSGSSTRAKDAHASHTEKSGDSISHYETPTTRHAEAAAGKPATTVEPVEPAPKPTEPLPLGTGCVSASCHATYLTSQYIHGPVSVGSCDSCHQEDAGQHTFPLKRNAVETCTFCHPIGRAHINQHAVLHDPGCLACHRPHVSDSKFLLTDPSIEKLCTQCHELPQASFAHGPFAAGECTACHYPHESDTKNLLRGGDGPEHCYSCHAETRHVVTNAPYQHEPAMQDCLICHTPHTADFEHQLRFSVEQSCFRCHEDVEANVTQASTTHGAVFTADRCANCHDPHGSGRPKLLRDRLDRLCLHCHDKPITATDGHTIPDMRPSITERKHLHGPVESGDCAACHNAHGSSHSKLLLQTFPSSFYMSFDLKNFALCFQCHEKDLVLSENTRSLTDFRDGDVNLHYLHVHREKKGRSCKACHAIHASDAPKHIAEEVPFDGTQWSMPIKYDKTDDGGRCAPGCHEPLAYSRNKRLNPPNGRSTR